MELPVAAVHAVLSPATLDGPITFSWGLSPEFVRLKRNLAQLVRTRKVCMAVSPLVWPCAVT